MPSLVKLSSPAMARLPWRGASGSGPSPPTGTHVRAGDGDLDDIAAQTGLSAAVIKRRLALNSLCLEVQAALAAGEITLGQAEAPDGAGRPR